MERLSWLELSDESAALYLVCGTTVDDGLDEDAQVFSGLSGLITLQTDP